MLGILYQRDKEKVGGTTMIIEKPQSKAEWRKEKEDNTTTHSSYGRGRVQLAGSSNSQLKL